MAKHAKKMEKQDRALYLHVNRRRGASRPGDGGEPKRYGEKPAQIDAGGRSQRALQEKHPRCTYRTKRGGRTPAEP